MNLSWHDTREYLGTEVWQQRRNHPASPCSQRGAWSYKERKPETAAQKTQDSSSPCQSPSLVPTRRPHLMRSFHGDTLSGDPSKSQFPLPPPQAASGYSVPCTAPPPRPNCHLYRLCSIPLHIPFNISWLSWKREEQRLSVHAPFNRFVMAITIFFLLQRMLRRLLLPGKGVFWKRVKCHLAPLVGSPWRRPCISGKPGSFQPRSWWLRPCLRWAEELLGSFSSGWRGS